MDWKEENLYEEEDYDREDDIYEDYQLVSEWNVRERTGNIDDIAGTIFSDNKLKGKYLDKLQKRLMLESLTDMEKFLFLLNNFSKYIFREEIGPISEPHKSKIEKIVSNIKYIKYKNPIAFLIAYFSLSEKKEQNKKDRDTIIDHINIDKITSFLFVLRDKEIEGITKEDIIRYARLIQSIHIYED